MTAIRNEIRFLLNDREVRLTGVRSSDTLLDHPRLRDAFARVIAAARGRGKHVGIGGLGSRPDLVAEFVRMGARYVSTGTDLAFLAAACAAQAERVHALKTH